MDTYVIIYFLAIAVGAFAAGVEERPITFYEKLYYKGESRTMAVRVGQPEGSPCGFCYNFKNDVAKQLKFRRPGSIEVPPDHYIRLYENFDCHGDHITFCGTACDCSSAHIDLSGNNHKCYVANAVDNFCPGDSDCHSVWGCLKQDNCYGDQPGLYSFSVHKRPEGERILWLEYPSTVFGTYISFEKCTANSIRRRRSTTDESSTCSCDVEENHSTKTKRDIRKDGVEYCFWRRWFIAMHYGNYLLQFTRTVANSHMISRINWSFIAPYGNFFGVQPRYGDNYANILYAVLVKIITNAVPREHKEALRICVSNVLDYRSAAMVPHIAGIPETSPGEAGLQTNSILTHNRILNFWKMIKLALDIVIGIPEGDDVIISESEVESFYHNIDAIETIWREGDGAANKVDRVMEYLNGVLYLRRFNP